MKLQFQYLINKMNAKELINFHYNQAPNPQVYPSYTFSSQHVINTAKVLKFTYQKAYQRSIVERVTSIPLVSYTQSVSQAQYRPQQSVQSSIKIKLVTKKHQKRRALSNVMPQYSSTELQQDQKIRNRLKTQIQQLNGNNSSVRNSNPEAAYTYKLPNHIQTQSNNKPYCELFSVCNQPDEQNQREKFKSAKETTISQQIKYQSKDRKPFPRLPIFQSDKISQFHVQEVHKMNQYESIQYEPQHEPAQMVRDYLISNKISSGVPQNQPFRRKSLFEALQPPPKQNIITVLDESIDLNDIPDVISKYWQKTEPRITQWHPKSQSNQSNNKQIPQFQQFQ